MLYGSVYVYIFTNDIVQRLYWKDEDYQFL